MSCKTILNVVKNHQWRSLFFQLWRYIIIAVGVPTVICLLLFSGLYSNKMHEEYENAFANSSYKSAENFKANIAELFRISIEASQEKEFIRFLEKNIDNRDYISEMMQYIEIKNLLQKYLYENEIVENVWIYSVKNDSIMSYGNKFNVEDAIEKDLTYEVIKKTDKCSVSKNKVKLLNSEEDEFCVITIAFPMYIDDFNAVDGVIAFNIPCENINNKILYIGEGKKENAAIMTKNGTIVSFENDEMSEFEHFSFSEVLKRSSKNGYTIEKKGLDTYCCVPDTDFDFIMLISSGTDNGKQLVKIIFRMIIVVLLIAMIAMIILSYAISIMVFNFMIAFVYGVEIYNVNDAKMMVDYRYLGKRFLLNMKKDAKIDEEFAVKMSKLRDMQVLALQNQINPHFIFNTLNFVNVMIIQITKRDCAPANVVSLLSDILHYSLNSEEFTATLSDELRYAQKYIEIERFKRDNSFEMITDADESVLKAKCVKFSLQPILENCIMHGFVGEKNNNGVIVLSIHKVEENIHIVIKNNGRCASNEKIRELNESFKNTDTIKRGRHIGLANVNQRLKIIFGTAASMRVYNEQNGFAVEIIYPFEK